MLHRGAPRTRRRIAGARLREGVEPRVEGLAEIHHTQTLNYMRVSRLRAGLLINFNVPVLKAGIRRKIL